MTYLHFTVKMIYLHFTVKMTCLHFTVKDDISTLYNQILNLYMSQSKISILQSQNEISLHFRVKDDISALLRMTHL